MYSRPLKETHRDTISYEIDMLKFCAQGFPNIPSEQQGEKNLYLEGFLLHYRNLIRFFSGKEHRGDDLSTRKPDDWTHIDNPAAIEEIQRRGQSLENSHYSDISKYLQHCTTLRSTESKGWKIDQMTEEIMPIIDLFETEFPEQ
jgi:hypothetical protein